MEAVQLRADHLPELYLIYRQGTSLATHCRFYPSEGHFARSLLNPTRAQTRLLVAEQDRRAHGFAAIVEQASGERGGREAKLTALFARDELAAGFLLDQCMALPDDIHQVVAFPADHGYCPVPSYNAGWDGLSDRLGSVARVLARSGFKPTYRELHLECGAERFPPDVTCCPSDVSIVEEQDTQGYDVLRALVDGQQAGICVFTLLNRVSDHPEAAGWGYIGWLHVSEGQRRRGLARHLLTSALASMQARGCSGCWLTTGADNWSAQPLYLSVGFEIVDASSCWIKMVGDRGARA